KSPFLNHTTKIHKSTNTSISTNHESKSKAWPPQAPPLPPSPSGGWWPRAAWKGEGDESNSDSDSDSDCDSDSDDDDDEGGEGGIVGWFWSLAHRF
ncbi:Os01g0220400, partial [Oryza sativa Japonica Group]